MQEGSRTIRSGHEDSTYTADKGEPLAKLITDARSVFEHAKADLNQRSLISQLETTRPLRSDA